MSSPQTQQPSESDNHPTIVNGLKDLIAHTKKDLGVLHTKPTKQLSHYRQLPENLQTAYDLLQQGATLVRATATKYALVGAINRKDQVTLAVDLLRGCELIAAAAHVTMPDPNGCSRALQEYTQKAALAIFVATLKLVEAFGDESTSTSKTTIAIASKDNNVGAQKTGAVWEACDHILNKMLPKGNRNAMRRQILTLTRECNDTMEEFQEMVELGAKEEAAADNVEEEEEDDYFGDDDDQYTVQELPMAKACLGLLKNSRGNMKVALEACEALGKTADGNEACLDSILEIHGHAKKVGEGVTDLGSLLYPPLQVTDLKEGLLEQAQFIVEFQDYLLGLDLELPESVTNLSKTLKASAENKQQDFLQALEEYRAGQE